jgi:hypothetical protein
MVAPGHFYTRPTSLADQVGKAVPVDLDSDGEVNGTGFLLGRQCPVRAVVAEGVVQNVNVDRQHTLPSGRRGCFLAAGSQLRTRSSRT